MECLKLEILNVIYGMNLNIDKDQLDKKITKVLSMYDIRAAKDININLDIQEKIEYFLNAKKLEGLSPLTLKGYRLILLKFAKRVNRDTSAITVNDIREYLSLFQNNKASTISTIISTLKSLFGWLYEEEVIIRDITKKIKSPKKEKRLPKALSIEELETLRDACKTPRERALLETLYATGCRLSEVSAMNRNDIDISDGSCKVIGKGNKERIVYFSAKARIYVRKYLMHRFDTEEALFVTERKPSRRVGNRAIQCEIAKIAARTNINKSIHPHIFRHTLATTMLNNGADLVTVQNILGHSDPATTQIYARISEKTKHDNYLKYHVQ